MREEWRDIPEYGGRYRVSNLGRVLNTQSGRWASSPERVLKNSIGNHGYPVVNLRKPGGSRTPVLVHRLVARTFLGECPEGQQVRHRNGDRSNPALRNLSYGTQADNEEDKKRHGTAREPEYLAKLTRRKVAAIRGLVAAGWNQNVLSAVFGVTPQTICDIKKQRSWVGVLPLSLLASKRVMYSLKGESV